MVADHGMSVWSFEWTREMNPQRYGQASKTAGELGHTEWDAAGT